MLIDDIDFGSDAYTTYLLTHKAYILCSQARCLEHDILGSAVRKRNEARYETLRGCRDRLNDIIGYLEDIALCIYSVENGDVR